MRLRLAGSLAKQCCSGDSHVQMWKWLRVRYRRKYRQYSLKNKREGARKKEGVAIITRKRRTCERWPFIGGRFCSVGATKFPVL